jgi:leucine-rich repeat kinase 1/leucine-rich repeat kinase 2
MVNYPFTGISMDEFRLRKDLFHKEYIFKVWDFGGQEDYYATHQCFLSTLSLYILVWNLEEGQEGIARLEGWLDTISARAPGSSSFIIVGTHLDKIRKDKAKYGEDYVSRMHKVIEELQKQPKYSKIDFKAIKEVSCAVDSREGKVVQNQ